MTIAILAAIYLVLLARTLVPAESPWHARKPLGCSVCMAGWASLLMVLCRWPPIHDWAQLQWLPLRWFAAALPVYLALEAFDRLPPPGRMTPPE